MRLRRENYRVRICLKATVQITENKAILHVNRPNGSGQLDENWK
jgi:hypothetical protein